MLDKESSRRFMSRLKQRYEREIVPTLAREFGIDNKMAVPRITKVVLNSGIGEVAKNKEILEQTRRDLSIITGQVPQVRSAKKSVASFGIRRGAPVGLKVTLRGERMYSFLDKLFSIVLPRSRDFRGVSKKSFDTRGNYTLGLAEHIVFPEIDLAKSLARGLEVTILTSTNDKDKSKRLMELLGMPFEKN